MADVIEGEFVEEGRALAVAQPSAPAVQQVSLFSGEPTEVIAQAVKVADALKAVVESKGLVKRIQGREFIEVAGWQTLGAMTRVSPFCEWTKETADGWEARVTVRNAMGIEIGAAEAECTRKEKSWSGRDSYAIRSMAQTRATSKALRMVLGFIVVLAGYRDTPAEEMGDEAPAAAPKRYPQAARTSEPPPRKGEPPIEPIASADEAEADAVKLGVSAIRALCQKNMLSVPNTDGLDRGQLVVIFKELQAKVRARVAAGPTGFDGVPIAARSVPSEAPAPEAEGSAPQDVPGGFPPVHVAAGGPAPVQAPQPKPVLDSPEIRDRARKALHAFCSGEKVPEDIRHQISYVMHGHSSSNDLDTSQLRSLRDKCAHWVAEKRPALATWEGLA